MSSTAAQLKTHQEPLRSGDYHERLERTREQLCNQLRGKKDIVELSLTAFLAGGHLLLEGAPGTGKTLLARSLAASFGGTFKRIQMTSDLLPSDIVGILRLRPGTSEFEFRKGPIFSNFLLADELNRTSPKTQSALLEAMAEGTVTVDGTPHALPDPFFVVATQNPLEFQGVYPLAESQLDRFMFQLMLDTPEKESELQVYQAFIDSNSHYSLSETFLQLEDVHRIRQEIQRVHMEESVVEYCLDLVRATRSLPQIAYGVSVRGGIQMIAAARALAFIRGRSFVIPDDVKALAIPVLAHRLCFTDGSVDIPYRQEKINGLLERIKAPR
jgi:MoxR-like ATPase